MKSIINKKSPKINFLKSFQKNKAVSFKNASIIAAFLILFTGSISVSVLLYNKEPDRTVASSSVGPIVSYQGKETQTTPAATLPESGSDTEKDITLTKEFRGFKQEVFARSITKPISLAFGVDGELFVSTEEGHIIVLRDTNLDGVADQKDVFATGFDHPKGLAYLSRSLYVSSKETVSILEDKNANGVGDSRQDIITKLPTGLNQTLSLVFDSFGKLYFSQGVDMATAEGAGKIFRADSNGWFLENFATGFYSPFDLAFHPKSGELFAVDSQVDGEHPYAELNIVLQGQNYGWPDCLENCQTAAKPLLEFSDTSEIRGLTFYRGSAFPKEYQDSLYLARGVEIGGGRINWEISQIKLFQTASGWSAESETFASDFKEAMDVAEGQDGALYISDYGKGEIIKISAKNETVKSNED